MSSGIFAVKCLLKILIVLPRYHSGDSNSLSRVQNSLNKKSFHFRKLCGREGIRTPDPLGVNQVL